MYSGYGNGYGQYGPNCNYGPPPDQYYAPPGPPPDQYYASPGPPPGPPPSGYYPPEQVSELEPPSGPPPRFYPDQGSEFIPPQGPPPLTERNYNMPPSDGYYSEEPSNVYQEYPRPPPDDEVEYQRPSMPPPPDAPQNFDDRLDFTYQYSNCTGAKKALLIGINYIGTSNELAGCINDVHNMRSFLNEHFGYSLDDIVVLTDDQTEPGHLPTKENIIRGMQWLVNDVKQNDSLVFHFSGHGGQTEDIDGDEESGFDDVIYPVDFETTGHITDDEMHNFMVKPLPAGCRLTALYDSCHSGTALDLPYVYSTKGVIKEPNLWKEAGEGALEAFLSYESGDVRGALTSLSGFAKKLMKLKDVDRDEVERQKMSPADIISISGCKDDQTSADTKEAGQSTGAMSWAFKKVLNEQPNQTFLSLLNNMRTLLSEKYSQKPQLSSSHPQDMEIAFIM